MTTREMKSILAQKLKDEGTYFTANDISIRQAKMPHLKWNEEVSDFQTEEVDSIRIIIKDYEHIHFFITSTVSDIFGDGIDMWRKGYDPDLNQYSEESIIISDYYRTDGDGLSNDEMYKEALIHLGYYIGNRF